MILLIGGTSETAPLAHRLVREGFEVLVSTATDVPLPIGEHPRIYRREGRLDEEGMVRLIEERRIRAIVDAAHPYAAAAHAVAQGAARRLGIPCLVLRRPEALGTDRPSGGDAVSAVGTAPFPGAAGSLPAPQTGDPTGSGRMKTMEAPVFFADDHAEAAQRAFSFDRPVLLTTGSRNLVPYAEAARRTGLPLVVRVLDHRGSVEACLAAGIPEERIIAGRGPFSVGENLAAIERFGIGVVVTKDSGPSGGVEAKLAAARRKNCRVVVIRRPATPVGDLRFDRPSSLIAALKRRLSGGG